MIEDKFFVWPQSELDDEESMDLDEEMDDEEIDDENIMDEEEDDEDWDNDIEE